MFRHPTLTGLAAGLMAFAGSVAADEVDREALHDTATSLFAPLPATMESDDNPLSEAKVELGNSNGQPLLCKQSIQWPGKLEAQWVPSPSANCVSEPTN